MRILFIDDKIQTPSGSNRIYIHNLQYWLRELGHLVDYNNDDYHNYNIVICDKNFPIKKALMIKQKTKALVGIANATYENIKYYDFVIAACQTEKIYSLQFNHNIVLFPQIERLEGYKIHNKTKTLTLCYHGNLEHLNELNPVVKTALEKFNEKMPIKLKAIYHIQNLGKWKYNRPNIEIEDVQWDFTTLPYEILSCDIGFVPNIVCITPKEQKLFIKAQKFLRKHKSGNDNDYLLRFKSTTNAGRAFVLHQLGLPVISDIYPDAYHILQTRNCGYLAHNEESWLYGLEKLAKKEERELVATNAKREFDSLYNPLEHAKSMIDDILEIKATFNG